MEREDNLSENDSGAIRAGHNSIFLLASQVISKLAGFAGVVLLARILTVSDFGLLALALAITGIVSLFVELGLDQLMIREVARDQRQIPAYFTDAMLIKLVLSIAALIVTILAVRLAGFDAGVASVIMILTLAMLPAGFYHLLVALFMGLEKMAWVAAGNSFGELLRLSLMALVLFAGYGLEAVAWTYVVSVSLLALAGFIVVRLKVSELLSPPTMSAMRVMVRQSIPFMFLGLFFVVYFKIDFIMLAWLKDEQVVGSYAAAFRLMESLLFVPAAFMGAVYPSLSRISSAGRDSVLRASHKTLRYMAMIGIPVGFGVTVLAERIVLLLFGESYSDSVLPLRIIIWAMVLIFINCVCPVGLNATNRQKLSVYVTATGIIVNIALNLFLIPPFGAVGTSVATVVTEMVTTAVFITLFSRNIGRLQLLPASYKPAIAGSIMAGCLLLLGFLPLWLLIPSGAAIYLLSLVALGALGRSDLELALALARPLAGRQNGSAS